VLEHRARASIEPCQEGSTVTTIPPPEPHGIAELLRLVGAVRWLAFDRTLPPSEALGRIRDAFQDYDHHGGASWKD
jgi:hypothetical protein